MPEINNVKITSKFTMAKAREALKSGGTLGELFGQLAKWLSDLHDSAFTGDAATVNTHTVETDVPSDAVFTDTVTTLASTMEAALNVDNPTEVAVSAAAFKEFYNAIITEKVNDDYGDVVTENTDPTKQIFVDYGDESVS